MMDGKSTLYRKRQRIEPYQEPSRRQLRLETTARFSSLAFFHMKKMSSNVAKTGCRTKRSPGHSSARGRTLTLITTTALALVKRGLGGNARQQAKCKKCYVCPACCYCCYCPEPLSALALDGFLLWNPCRVSILPRRESDPARSHQRSGHARFPLPAVMGRSAGVGKEETPAALL